MWVSFNFDRCNYPSWNIFLSTKLDIIGIVYSIPDLAVFSTILSTSCKLLPNKLCPATILARFGPSYWTPTPQRLFLPQSPWTCCVTVFVFLGWCWWHSSALRHVVETYTGYCYFTRHQGNIVKASPRFINTSENKNSYLNVCMRKFLLNLASISQEKNYTCSF